MRNRNGNIRNADWWLCFWRACGEIQLPLIDGRRRFKPHLGIDQDNICQLPSGKYFKIIFSDATTFPSKELPILAIPENDPDKSWWCLVHRNKFRRIGTSEKVPQNWYC